MIIISILNRWPSGRLLLFIFIISVNLFVNKVILHKNKFVSNGCFATLLKFNSLQNEHFLSGSTGNWDDNIICDSSFLSYRPREATIIWIWTVNSKWRTKWMNNWKIIHIPCVRTYTCKQWLRDYTIYKYIHFYFCFIPSLILLSRLLSSHYFNCDCFKYRYMRRTPCSESECGVMRLLYINIYVVSIIPNWYTVLFRSRSAFDDDDVVLDINSNTQTRSQTQTHTHSFVDIGGIHRYVGLIYVHNRIHCISCSIKRKENYTILLNKFHSRTLILCCDYLLPPVTTTTTTSRSISVSLVTHTTFDL